MADYRLFVTAPSATPKLINEVLVYLRDWEDGSGDAFHLQTSKTIDESEKTSEEPVSIPITVPGSITTETFHNEWAGASLEEVESFAAKELMGIASPQAHVSFFVVLDEQGVEDHTVLGVAQEDEEDEDETDEEGDEDDEDGDGGKRAAASSQAKKVTDNTATRYNKVRMPWHGAYLFCANLGESNMGFEEFCDQDVGADDRLFWRLNEDLAGDECGEDARRKRDKFLGKLRREGKI